MSSVGSETEPSLPRDHDASTSEQSVVPCYSARSLLPFARLLERCADIPAPLRARLIALDVDERIPIATVHGWLTAAVALTHDLNLGLAAAREINVGDYGVVEYAARSARTWGDACLVAGRYIRLLNDALQCSLHSDGERAYIQLENSVPLPRAAADFQSAAFHLTASHFWPSGATPDIEVWFSHVQPHDIEPYQRTFAGAVLCFGAPFNGFAMPKHYLSQPVERADPKLHALIRKHADTLLAKLPGAETVATRVRNLLVRELAGGSPSVTQIARQLPMGERMLARRLSQEGTSFKELIDDLRRRLALDYVAGSDVPLTEVALRLNFSQTPAFYRAFKRWTGETPREYRRAHRG
jgi:AraC-like DNA-binding protein